MLIERKEKETEKKKTNNLANSGPENPGGVNQQSEN
jgi:hypothetical protein